MARSAATARKKKQVKKSSQLSAENIKFSEIDTAAVTEVIEKSNDLVVNNQVENDSEDSNSQINSSTNNKPCDSKEDSASDSGGIRKYSNNLTKEEIDAEFKALEEKFSIYIKNYKFTEDISKNGKRKLIKNLRFQFFKPIKQVVKRIRVKRKKAEERGAAQVSKRQKVNTVKDSENKLKIAIDCSFDDLMSEKDVSKLSLQIQRCYSINRHMENPLQLHFTNIDGKLLSRMEDCMDGYKNWDVIQKSESLVQIFNPQDIVYLCAESENYIAELDVSKVYAIGGFVDHNAHKGLAYKRAIAAGFSHARLPIDSFFTLATRKVLTVCHVFEIISNFCNVADWKIAIKDTIPERKGLEEKPNLLHDFLEQEILPFTDPVPSDIPCLKEGKAEEGIKETVDEFNKTDVSSP